MPVVDVHTHLLPPDLPRWKERFGYGGFIQLEHTGPCRARMLKDDGQAFREVEETLWAPAARLADCDRLGVDVQVLSTVPVMFSYWAKPEDGAVVARFLNDHLASIVSGAPDRFIGLGTLPMQVKTATIEGSSLLERSSSGWPILGRLTEARSGMPAPLPDRNGTDAT